LTVKHENVKAKWANVETQLQRRSDLLSNLIETAKLAGVQEQEVFGKIAEARSKLLNASQQAPQGEGGDKTPEQKQAVIDAANSFGGTVGRLLALQEQYPQLRSNENFLKHRMKWPELKTVSPPRARTTTTRRRTTTQLARPFPQ